jgi:hypothetical protein
VPYSAARAHINRGKMTAAVALEGAGVIIAIVAGCCRQCGQRWEWFKGPVLGYALGAVPLHPSPCWIARDSRDSAGVLFRLSLPVPVPCCAAVVRVTPAAEAA